MKKINEKIYKTTIFSDVDKVIGRIMMKNSWFGDLIYKLIERRVNTMVRMRLHNEHVAMVKRGQIEPHIDKETFNKSFPTAIW